MVSEFEERSAARASGYPWRDWLDLDRGDRVDGVAHYRLDRIVENNANEVVTQVGRDRAEAARSKGK